MDTGQCNTIEKSDIDLHKYNEFIFAEEQSQFNAGKITFQ